MDNESLKNDEPLQLQQMNVFLKTELAKYKNEVDKLRNSDYYSLVLRLERENVQLTSKEKELSKELFKLKKEFEKEVNNYTETIQSQEKQREKHISSIDSLLKDRDDLRIKNKQLSEDLKKVQDELEVYKQDRLELWEADYKAFIENLEDMMIVYIQETGKQMHSVVEKFEMTHKEISESDNVKKYLVKEIDVKNNEIDKLLKELAYLKEPSEDLIGSSSTSLKGEFANNPQALAYVDAQVNKVLGQSKDFEEQLDAKLRILDDLEQKLNQLTVDIDGNKSKNNQ
ncbi:hypothetical protein ACIQZG_05960 [Lysinibacillus sp. NPDC096418]|uniref:hypothetical protein n=1 Tax=Lysinibacillus sp. NPDC096418 TaxID=3364138 RepID=UPI00381FE644